jgi:hypothetical protein
MKDEAEEGGEGVQRPGHFWWGWRVIITKDKVVIHLPLFRQNHSFLGDRPWLHLYAHAYSIPGSCCLLDVGYIIHP